jgi:hypothetical protein
MQVLLVIGAVVVSTGAAVASAAVILSVLFRVLARGRAR